VWAQPPRCAAVLSISPSITPKIEEIIQNLAEMKLNLDLAWSNGLQNVQNRNLKNIYAAKFQELKEHLGQQVSENQIRDMISDRIRSLQNRDNEVFIKENNDREQTNEALRLVPTLIDVNYDGGVRKDLTYAKVADSLVSYSGPAGFPDGISIFDLKNHTNKVVKFESVVSKISGDGQVYFIDFSGKFKIYDIGNSSFKQMGTVRRPFKGISSTLISPSHEWVALVSSDNVFFENAISGQAGRTFENPLRRRWFHSFSKKQVPDGHILKSLFLNDSEVLIELHTVGSTPALYDTFAYYHFNFKTGATKVIDTDGEVMNNLTPQPLSETLYFTIQNKLFEIKYQDLEELKTRSNIYAVGSGKIRSIKFTPDGSHIYINTVSNGTAQEYYTPLNSLSTNIAPMPNVDPSISLAEGTPAFDLDNQRIYISRKIADEANPNNKTHYVESRGIPHAK
jgi:hypothetical protein